MPLFNIVLFCTALTSKRMAFMWMSLLAVSVVFNLHMLASRGSCSLSSVLHTGGHGLTSVELPRSPSEIEASASPTNACSFSPQKQISFGKTITTVHINVGLWKNPISCDPSTCYVLGFEPNLEHYGHDSSVNVNDVEDFYLLRIFFMNDQVPRPKLYCHPRCCIRLPWIVRRPLLYLYPQLSLCVASSDLRT